jgi:hypothetical protein
MQTHTFIVLEGVTVVLVFPQMFHFHLLFRTARADNEGTALSFVAIKDEDRMKEIEAALSENQGET